MLEKYKPLSLTYRLANAQPVLRTRNASDSPTELPESITLIYMGAKDDKRPELSPEHYQLYIGCHAIPSGKWHYDAQSKYLVFDTSRFSGRLRQSCLSDGCRGILSAGGETYTTEYLSPELTYELELAKGGAYVDTSCCLVKAYGEESSEWKKAWAEEGEEPSNREKLLFTYGLESFSILGETVYEIAVKFKVPGCLWTPRKQDYTCIMDEDFSIRFNMGKYARTGSGSPLFPYQLVGQLNAFGDTLTGAILTGRNDEHGIPYGIRGTYVDDSTVCGTYQLEGGGTFCVTGGRLYIDGHIVENSQANGRILSWDFSENGRREVFSRILPEKGILEFSADGSRITGGGLLCNGTLLRNGKPEGTRLSADDAVSADRADALPDGKERPTYYDLLAMTPYRFDSEGRMHEVIQERTMEDFQKLLEYYIPDDLYQKFIASEKQLPDKLRDIAKMRTDDGKDAAEAYEPFCIAYLTCILSQVKDDKAAKTLNAIRASLYIKEKMPKSEIFMKQSPAIYRMEWLAEFPKMQDYIDDQKKNADYYKPFIEADRSAWIKETESQLNDGTSYNAEILEERVKHIGKLADKAISEGKYWAYFLMRYAMSDTFLREMQQLCITPEKESANDLIHTLQQIMTLITLLDDSRQDSLFVQEYARTISSFQLASVMPMFLDFSELEEKEEVCNALKDILKKFTEIYAGSTDKDIKDCVERINGLTDEDYERLFRHVFEAFSPSGKNNRLRDYGFIEWETLVVDAAAAIFALSVFISGKGKWDDLGEVDKAMLGTHIAHLIGVELLAKGIRRGVLIHMLSSTEGFWKRFGNFFWFSKALKETAVDLAKASLPLSFKKWFLTGVDMTGQSMREAAQSCKYGWFFSEKSMKFFGKSFSDFMLRVGIVFALADIAFSLYYLITEEDTLSYISNGLFLAASVLDIASLSIGISGMAGGWLIASTVIGAVGVAMSVIGFIVWGIKVFTKKEETPVAAFAREVAKEYGFYMPEGYAVDCLEYVPSSDGTPSRDCVAIYTGECGCSLKVNSDGSILTDRFDGKMGKAFKIDAAGDYARILLLSKNGKEFPTPLYLTRIGDEIKAMPFSGNEESGQEWKCTAISGCTYNEDGMLIKANFTLSHKEKKNGKDVEYFLNLSPDKKSIGYGKAKTEWTLEMKSSSAEGLKMDDVKLATSDRNKTFTPSADNWGCSPKVFSISPSLPNFMEVDENTGRIYQKEGVAPVIMKSRHTLFLKDGLENLVSTEFMLSIV